MTTVINTNLASLFAQNSLSNAQNNLATSVQRLSSGLRINSAKDDAAGLAIAQNMQSQINGTNQSINNLSDATNLLQTADSSLSTIQDMLLKMKQLAVQGYDGSLNSTQKADIVTQMQDLNNEINATAQRTQFNGINLLTSGSSIDAVNSDLKTGATLVNTQVAVLGATASQGLGYYSTAGSAPAASANLGDSASTGAGAVNSTFKINIDPTMQNQTPGSYTLTSNGANLTLTGTINGLASSQTVVVGDVSGGNQGGPGVTNFHQNLNFSNFGINLDTYSTVSAGATEQGQTIASALVTKGTNNGISTIQVAGTTASISDVRLSGVAPGTYTMTFDNLGPVNSLSLPATTTGFDSTGVAGTRVVSLTGGTGAGASAAVSYDATGKITSVNMQNQGSGYKAGDVLSMAAAANPVDEFSKAQFGTLTSGQTVQMAGLTFTAGANGATAAQIANAFSNIAAGGVTAATLNTQNSLSAATGGTFTGTSTSTISTGAVSGTNSDTIVFDNGSGTSVVNIGTAAGVSSLATTYGAKATVATTAGIVGAKESDTITMTVGEKFAKGSVLSINGLNYTVSVDGATAAQITTDFGAIAAGGTTGASSLFGTFSGALSAGAIASTANVLTYTATANGVSTPAVSVTGPVAAQLTGLAAANLTGAQTGSNYLTLSGTVNGVVTKQSVVLQANAANNTETVNFGQFGVAFDVHSNQAQTAAQIGAALANINSASATFGTTSNYIPGQIVVGQGNNSNLQFQSGANSSAFIGINTLNVQTGTTGSTAGTSGAMMTLGTDITGTNATGASAAGTLGAMTSNNTISDWQTAFQNAAAAVDKAVDYISTQRATYGSQMNRLSYISTNLTTQSTNLQTSKSSITDTNFASETANLTKGQIMQQAATAMLAQANQMPNVILSLLK